MSLSYRIDSDNLIVRLELSSVPQIEEIQRTVEELLSDPAFRPGLHILSDHSRLRDTATTALVKETIPLLKRIAEQLGPFKCAVVAPRDGSFGMARMAEAYAQETPAEVRAFRTKPQAEAWLRGEPAA